MTGASQNNGTANGLRLIDSEIGPVVPIMDITKQIGYSRSAATRVIQRHKKSFVGLTAVVSIKTPAGTRRVKCLSKPGIEEFIKCLMPDPVLYPDLAARVNEFKIKALGLPREPAPALPLPANPLLESLNRNADVARVMIERFDCPPERAHRIALGIVANDCPDAALPWQNALTPTDERTPPPALPAPAEIPQCCKECVMVDKDPDYDRTFGIKHTAELCGLKNDYPKAQRILEKQEILIHTNASYHLSRLGEMIGAGKVFTTYPEAPHRMTPKKVIRYFPVAIERIKTALAAEQAQLVEGDRTGSGIPQTTALAGHCGSAEG